MSKTKQIKVKNKEYHKKLSTFVYHVFLGVYARKYKKIELAEHFHDRFT